MSNRTARIITGSMRNWKNSSRMHSTANNKTKRMIQERVPDKQASFFYKFLLKSLQNFTIMFKNIQFIKSDVDKQ
jgi:hypothetical protein